MQRRGDDAIRILDLGCSYGVNAALLKHDLSMEDLYEHWGQTKLADAASEDVIARDESFFAEFDDADGIEVIGLDQAQNAISFAEKVGLLDEGLAEDLEIGPLSARGRKNWRPSIW